jgi:hypothetical protein
MVRPHCLSTEDGGSVVFENAGIRTYHCTVSQPRRPRLEASSPWKAQNSPLIEVGNFHLRIWFSKSITLVAAGTGICPEKFNLNTEHTEWGNARKSTRNSYNPKICIEFHTVGAMGGFIFLQILLLRLSTRLKYYAIRSTFFDSNFIIYRCLHHRHIYE